jgi:hypothetical protein
MSASHSPYIGDGGKVAEMAQFHGFILIAKSDYCKKIIRFARFKDVNGLGEISEVIFAESFARPETGHGAIYLFKY